MPPVNHNEAEENVILATLVRGKAYTYHVVEEETGKSVEYIKFERAVPKPISAELADKLELLTEEVPDRDGEMIEKDMFLIDRDATARGSGLISKRIRTRIVREEIEEAPRKPKLRMPQKIGTKPVTGFRGRNAG